MAKRWAAGSDAPDMLWQVAVVPEPGQNPRAMCTEPPAPAPEKNLTSVFQNFLGKKEPPKAAPKQVATVEVAIMEAAASTATGEGSSGQLAASQQTWLLAVSPVAVHAVPQARDLHQYGCTAQYPRGAVAVRIATNGSPGICPAAGLHGPLPMRDTAAPTAASTASGQGDAATGTAAGTAERGTGSDAAANAVPSTAAAAALGTAPSAGSLASKPFLIAGSFLVTRDGSLPRLAPCARAPMPGSLGGSAPGGVGIAGIGNLSAGTAHGGPHGALAAAAAALHGSAAALARAGFNAAVLQAVADAWQLAMQWLVARYAGPREQLYELLPNIVAAQAGGFEDAAFCFKAVSNRCDYALFYHAFIPMSVWRWPVCCFLLLCWI